MLIHAPMVYRMIPDSLHKVINITIHSFVNLLMVLKEGSIRIKIFGECDKEVY